MALDVPCYVNTKFERFRFVGGKKLDFLIPTF